jgi:hypothetical protein
MSNKNNSNESVATILSRLTKELEEIKTFSGKPKRIYNAYKGYVIGHVIQTLTWLLTQELGQVERKQTEHLLHEYHTEATSLNP